MNPHPDFADVDLPREVALPSFRLTRLSPEVLDEDYAAVSAAGPLLRGLFGDWPDGLTREENLIDLAWHEREFTVKRSFCWVVRSLQGTYLGCAYLFPALGARGRADVATWIGDVPDRLALSNDLVNELAAWFASVLPEGITLSWARPTAG